MVEGWIRGTRDARPAGRADRPHPGGDDLGQRRRQRLRQPAGDRPRPLPPDPRGQAAAPAPRHPLLVGERARQRAPALPRGPEGGAPHADRHQPGHGGRAPELGRPRSVRLAPALEPAPLARRRDGERAHRGARRQHVAAHHARHRACPRPTARDRGREGIARALPARMVPYYDSTDHHAFTPAPSGVPATSLTNWPDEFIHSTGDDLENIDATQLERNAVVVAAVSLYFATLADDDVPALAAYVAARGRGPARGRHGHRGRPRRAAAPRTRERRRARRAATCCASRSRRSRRRSPRCAASRGAAAPASSLPSAARRLEGELGASSTRSSAASTASPAEPAERRPPRRTSGRWPDRSTCRSPTPAPSRTR